MTTPTKKPAAKRGPGRPRKTAAAKPTGPQRPQPVIEPDPLPADDKHAQSIADQLADVAATAAAPSGSASGGRPTAREGAMNQLADNLATIYQAVGGGIKVLALPLMLSARSGAFGQRLLDLGDEIESNAIECGNALARWADTNPKVKEFLTGASGHAGMILVIAVHLPILGAAVGKREAGRLAGDLAGKLSGDGPTDGMADAFGFAEMMGAMFTAAGSGAATADQRPNVVDTTATETTQAPGDVAA